MRARFAVLPMCVAALFAMVCVLASALRVAQAAPPAPAMQESCDRACMKNILDEYLVALVKHDDSGLPLAKNYKYTENTAQIRLGDGLWVGASELPTFRIYGIDPVSGRSRGLLRDEGIQQAGARHDSPAHPGPQDHRDRAHRPPRSAPRRLAESRHAAAGLAEDMPPGERTPRAEMLRIGDEYFDSIVKGNGKLAPFAD